MQAKWSEIDEDLFKMEMIKTVCINIRDKNENIFIHI